MRLAVVPRALFVAVTAALFLAPFAASRAQVSAPPCGALTASEGPYDYRTEKARVRFIEGNHFRPEVEALIRGVSGPVGGDIAFLLNHVPNHHRALVAMTKLSERYRWQQPPGARWSVECYYERALRFRPDDVVARLLYAAYLGKRERRDDALLQLTRAAADAGDNGFTHYNLGLQYFELGELDKAAKHAAQARALGFPRTDLADRLQARDRLARVPNSGRGQAVSRPPSSAE